MEHDRLYYWDYIGSNGTRTLLGEIQTNFNMGLSIDGSKDTCKVECFTRLIADPIKPYSVCQHENTDTWWIVGKDKVERYVDESGYLYKHSIQLEGAIELLNARDLTDCGFYQNMYTIDEFARRLVKLSTFELKNNGVVFSYGTSLDGNKVVDYIKSFENYTLLSALREFFDGYNCAIKLWFSVSNGELSQAHFDIIPKTGVYSPTIKNLDDYMNDVKGIGTMSKGSYGNTVISNAENVVSTHTKIYPTIGYARLGSTDFYLDSAKNNIVFRLPSKVSSVEYIEASTSATYICAVFVSSIYNFYHNIEIPVDLSDQEEYSKAINQIRSFLTTKPGDVSQDRWNEIQSAISGLNWTTLSSNDKREEIEESVSLRFYDTTEYDPMNNEYHNEHGIDIFHTEINVGHGSDKPWVLGNKTLRDGVQEPQSVMYWERGSNEIKGFDFFDWHKSISGAPIVSTKERYGYEVLEEPLMTENQYGYMTQYGTVQIFVTPDANDVNGHSGALYLPIYISLSPTTTRLRCKYIPMSNLKIKYDNHAFGNDSKLYNQNGKYTDGVALSRSLLSYKNEIESDTITRYAVGSGFDDMPYVGSVYYKNGVPYVIDNASYDFNQDELGYFITAEYTLSKKIAVKTALTNPNTNIRDYGIPQSYNVSRKQLYRDFYELSFARDVNEDVNYYLTLNNVVNLTYAKQEYEGHTALIRIDYSHGIGGGGTYKDGSPVLPSDNWYFQVDSTYYTTKKQLVEVFDFQDNNIIGYDSQNLTCGFDITRLFEIMDVGSDKIDAVNTPISYVDEKGCFEEVHLAVLNAMNLKKVWGDYIDDEKASYTGTMNDKGSYYNRCVFIPSEVYVLGVNYADYRINDSEYNKDPIEVPVFEYCCQIDDSDDVIIGDEILSTKEDDFIYFYEAIVVPKNAVNNNTWKMYFVANNIHYQDSTFSLNYGNSPTRGVANFTLLNTEMRIDIYRSLSIEEDLSATTLGTQLNAYSWLSGQSGDVDLMIVRYAVPKDYTLSGQNITNVRYDLMFVIKNAKQCPHTSDRLDLCINHYRLH